MCGIAVIMALLSTYVPFLLIFYIFVPLPIVILAKRQNFLTALLSAVAASGILFFLIEWTSAAVYAGYLVLVGLSLGWTTIKNAKGIIRVGVTYIAVLLVFLGSLFLYQMVSGVPFMDELMATLQLSTSQVTGLYQASGLLSAEQLTELTQAVDGMAATIKLLLPTVFLLVPAVIAWLNVLLCDGIFAKMKIDSVPVKPVSQWRLPGSLKFFLMGLVIVVSILQWMETDMIPEIYFFTITEIVNLVFIVMGISFCFWFFNRKRAHESTGIKGLILVLTLLLPPVSMAMSLVGVADAFLHLKEVIALADERKGKR